MTTLTIKNIPIDLYHNLKQQAALNHRSLNSEVIITLKQAIKNNKLPVEAVLKKARELRAETEKHPVTEKTLKAAKEQGRI